ncbi:MAG: hypothetical protein GX329_04040 [Tissierellia bacterium]|nr:hypothetical protein [Tissierellia bacterium]
MMDKRDLDIIKNLRTIEWLKGEILSSVASLYKILADGEYDAKEDIEDLIANVILSSLLLSKRLGVDYEDVGSSLLDKVKLNLIEEHKIEQWHGDLSELLEFLMSS